jgi:hypothetical protein
MRKRIAKKVEARKLYNFIHNINQECEQLREDFYLNAYYRHCRSDDDDDMTDVCLCDECIIELHQDVHHTAWQQYQDMLKEHRDFTRIINLGSRKIEIDLRTDGSGRANHWHLDGYALDKQEMFDRLTDDEKLIALYHKHFYNY